MSKSTDCSKCKAPMTEPPKTKRENTLSGVKFTVTAYLCSQCGHWNDLRRRKK